MKLSYLKRRDRRENRIRYESTKDEREAVQVETNRRAKEEQQARHEAIVRKSWASRQGDPEWTKDGLVWRTASLEELDFHSRLVAEPIVIEKYKVTFRAGTGPRDRASTYFEGMRALRRLRGEAVYGHVAVMDPICVELGIPTLVSSLLHERLLSEHAAALTELNATIERFDSEIERLDAEMLACFDPLYRLSLAALEKP